MDEQAMAEIEAAIADDDPEELLGVIIELALAAEDAEWAEDVCLRLARHADTNVRGNAVVCFAHLAERFGHLDRERVEPVVVAALSDPNEYVREQAEVARAVLGEALGWG